MGFTLKQIVPWGRSYDEYVAMFALSGEELQRSILGCGDGPASFNAELTRLGGHVVSIDPVYRFSATQIRQRIAETYDTVIEQLSKNRNDYVWTSIPSPEKLGALRLAAMELFLEDFESGKKAGRYLPGELPGLPTSLPRAGLALCSHFLFLYGDHLSLDFHVESLKAMLRAADEARVFPLVALDGRLSPHVTAAIQVLNADGFQCRIRSVPYEFQRGGNQMLSIRKCR